MPIDPSKPSTNTNGSPAPSDEYSLTVGADGPVVLHDAHLVDTLAHFNRENIPERKPHAKGSGAFGHLEVTADVSEYTKASFPVSYTHLTLPTKSDECRSRWSPYH